MSPRFFGEGTAAILHAIRQGHRHGADIMDATGQGGGTVYKVLRRLEERGLVDGMWEDAARAEAERRPRRRYYQLTAEGRGVLAQATERYRLPARGSTGSVSPGRSR
jgi:PadR family transcriptional regulator